MVFSILCWVHSEPSGSVPTSFWIHLSVSVISNETLLFCSSSDSLLTFLGGSIPASLHMVSLHFPCSMHSSGLSFQQERLLTDFLSNCSIAWFITSWKSFMNSIRSALQLTSDKLSSSSDSSWSLLWSGGDCFATSCGCTFPVQLLDSPVISHLSVDRHHRTCSHVFGGISSTTHYSFYNVLDILHVWCFSSRFPYCFCFAFWCRRFFFCILSMISSHVFAYWYMLDHTCRMISLARSCSLLQCLLQLPISMYRMQSLKMQDLFMNFCQHAFLSLLQCYHSYPSVFREYNPK